MKTKYTDVAIVVKKDAQKKNYKNTIVVDLTGNNKETATALAQVLHAEVGTLPEGEVAPPASYGAVDLLVILGQNYGK